MCTISCLPGILERLSEVMKFCAAINLGLRNVREWVASVNIVERM